MNRIFVALATSAALASGSALACNDMKVTDSDDGGVISSQAPAAPVASSQKVDEAPLVVKQKQPAAKKASTSGKPLPQGATLARSS